MILLNMFLVIGIFSSSRVSDSSYRHLASSSFSCDWGKISDSRFTFDIIWYGHYHDQAIQYYSPYDDQLDYGTYVLLDAKSFRFPLLSALLPCFDLQVVGVFRTILYPVYFVTYSL